MIGTHRLLSKDVKFHDLGLLIVDEEQRFGVAHKERLKEMRKNVDVADACPPRPFRARCTCPWSACAICASSKRRRRTASRFKPWSLPFRRTLVQRAIEDEMARDGQVYFIHNRVESIYLARGAGHASWSPKPA